MRVGFSKYLISHSIAILLLTNIGSLVLLSSCAPPISFKKFSADSPRTAIEEIVRMKKNLLKFQADADIQLTLPNGSYKVQATLKYEKENRWLINIAGPFGLKLARIKTDSKRYIVDMIMKGSSFSGYLDEPITIESMDLELPRLDLFVNLLLPVIDINVKNIVVLKSPSYVGNSTLVIEYDDMDAVYQLRLNLSYDPLIVYSEERIMDDNILYLREFKYNSIESYFPEIINISHRNLKVKITYDNIYFEDRKLKNI